MAEGPEILSPRDGYDRWAEVYDDDGNPLLALEEPEVDRLLGSVENLDVADIGCGTGRHALRLAKTGARVAALDFSEGMLARARRQPGAAAVNFFVHDLDRPLPFQSASFDRVLCCLVLEHVLDLASAFREFGRICRPSGSIVVTCMHPSMMLKGVQARFFDRTTGQEIRPASQPHQICDYLMGAIRADLRFVEIGERTVGEELGIRFPRGRKYLGWPMLFFMHLTPR
jgi:ubiquinone/menaquinone biosynthesis C-methylase UbiE